MGIISELVSDARFILNYRMKHAKTQKDLDRLAPKTDDIAPDFTLTDISGNRLVTLSDFQGEKLVALVFGSFT